MRVVVADTGPVHYLLLIGQIGILHRLFEKIIIPSAVCAELLRPETPNDVRIWMQQPPSWLEIRAPQSADPPEASLDGLDDGEQAALVLAGVLNADLLLLDDRDGVRAARLRGFRVIGTRRVLQLASKRGFLDLADSFDRIKRTNFRYRQEIMDELIREMGDA